MVYFQKEKARRLCNLNTLCSNHTNSTKHTKTLQTLGITGLVRCQLKCTKTFAYKVRSIFPIVRIPDSIQRYMVRSETGMLIQKATGTLWLSIILLVQA